VLDYDREAAHYDATRGGDARADAAARAIEALLARAAGDAVRLADIGCGTGIVTCRLLRPGRSVIGIDRSAGMAAVAAGRLPGRVALTDLARRRGLSPAAQTTFVGAGQGASPRRWRSRLARDHDTAWIPAAGPEQIDALRAELARLPDQDRARPDPVYQLAALRKS
jgi:SAM-dependent methyltransferase